LVNRPDTPDPDKSPRKFYVFVAVELVVLIIIFAILTAIYS